MIERNLRNLNLYDRIEYNFARERIVGIRLTPLTELWRLHGTGLIRYFTKWFQDTDVYTGPQKLNSHLRLCITLKYGSKYTTGSPASIQGKSCH